MGSFAAYVYNGYPLAYNSVVYRTEALKSVDFANNDKVYGKIADRPMIYDSISSGKGIILIGQFVQYRIHDGQDSQNNKTGPFCNQTLSLHKKYRDLIFSQGTFFDKLIFESNVYYYMKDEFKRLSEKDSIGFDEYVNGALKMGIVTDRVILLGKFLNIVKYNFIKRVFRVLTRLFFQYS